MNYSYEEGESPVLELKRIHSMKRKSGSRKRSQYNNNINEDDDNVVVLEDLGADYLEELLNATT
ncbi:ethylene-responsive transcription factor 1B-like [Tripterygium wilfordii]|uniref:Ethylene-responsive transcription factor 1B-like n=2 Tax=Tripterygium wilfordii TaxID=458696 RepID=A0A7J7D2D3_TRIWF|nr:ethylene-responsive transcription factor 1B-like [Tripterygium wilfordii]